MDPIDEVLRDPAFTERYEVQAKIGEGGMGVVFRGVQKSLARPVAIKFMHGALAETRSFQERFLSEGRLAASIIHTHVVAVFDRGVCQGVPFLVTEFVEGPSLGDLMRVGPPQTPAFVFRVARQVLSGLEALHARQIVHRDLKPSNILIAPGPCAKVHDFGIAKQFGAGGSSPGRDLTAAGLLVGTPQYMSPEQALGQELTPASDLYSFTVVLFEMVTRRVPFDAPTVLDILNAHVREPVPSPPGLPPKLAELIRTGMAKSSTDRYPDAATYLGALDAAAVGLEGLASFESDRTPGRRQETSITPRPASASALLCQPSEAGGARTSTQMEAPLLEQPAAFPGLTPVPPASRSAWHLVAWLAVIVALAGVLVYLRGPGERISRSAAPWAVRFLEVRETARRGQLAEAVRLFFATTRSQPELGSMPPQVIATSELAADADRTLLVLLEAAARLSAEPGAPPGRTPPGPPDFRSADSFYAFGVALRDRDFARLKELVEAWEMWRQSHGGRGPDPDAASLHAINAVSWLGTSARIAVATQPWQVIAAVTELQDQVPTHAGNPLGYWSVQLEAAAVSLSAMPRIAARFAAHIEEQEAGATTRANEDGLKTVARYVDEARRSVEARWKTPSRDEIAQARACMLSALIIRNVCGYGARWIRTEDLKSRLERKPEAALVSDVEASTGSSFDLSNPPAPRLLCGLARGLGLEDFGLVEILEQ